MKKIRRHEFIIVPLEYVRLRQADVEQIMWIRKWGKQVSTVQHTRWQTGEKEPPLKAEPLPRYALTTDEVKRPIHQQLNNRRLSWAASRVRNSLKGRLGN